MPAGRRGAAADEGVLRSQRGDVRGLCDTTPLVEGLSIDEAFLDVGGLRRIAGAPKDIAARLRVDVRERVGIPITVGVARTKFLAKVASGVAKPDGLLVVPVDGELAFLHALPVERLWGSARSRAVQLAFPFDGRDLAAIDELRATDSAHPSSRAVRSLVVAKAFMSRSFPIDGGSTTWSARRHECTHSTLSGTGGLGASALQHPPASTSMVGPLSERRRAT